MRRWWRSTYYPRLLHRRRRIDHSRLLHRRGLHGRRTRRCRHGPSLHRRSWVEPLSRRNCAALSRRLRSYLRQRRLVKSCRATAGCIMKRLGRAVIIGNDHAVVIVRGGAERRIVHGQPCRAAIILHRSSCSRCRNTRYRRWRRWRTEPSRWIREARLRSPAVPQPWLPYPAITIHKHPLAITIGHPSPRIRRDPDITKPRLIAPIAVRKRVPSDIYAVRLPAITVAGNVVVLPVIIQIGESVLIR